MSGAYFLGVGNQGRGEEVTVRALPGLAQPRNTAAVRQSPPVARGDLHQVTLWPPHHLCRHHCSRRLVVMYTVLVMIGLLSAHTAAAIWLRWPAGVKLGAALVAIFLLLAGVAVLALTAGLKVGNDG